MPLALLVGGSVASLAGTGLQIAGNEKAKSAMNATRKNAVDQQGALQRQSSQIANDSIAASGPQSAATQTAQGAATRMALTDALRQGNTPIAAANPVGTSASTGATGAAGNAWTNLVAGNQAKAGSYADWENQQAIKNAEAGQKIGVLNNFSQGDAALLPVEMQVASQKGDKLSGWGSLVQGLGSAAMLGGAIGMAAAPAAGSAGSGVGTYGTMPGGGNATAWQYALGQVPG